MPRMMMVLILLLSTAPLWAEPMPCSIPRPLSPGEVELLRFPCRDRAQWISIELMHMREWCDLLLSSGVYTLYGLHPHEVLELRERVVRAEDVWNCLLYAHRHDRGWSMSKAANLKRLHSLIGERAYLAGEMPPLPFHRPPTFCKRNSR